MIDTSISRALLPDYSKSARSVNIAVVRTYINISKKLDILGCANEKPTANRPSWCPDWNEKPTNRILAVDPDHALYGTSGMTEAVATFSKDESTIYLKGFLICTVRDDCFQGSKKPFIYKEFAGVRSNWNIKLGLAPQTTKNGDEIWIFMGASTPFVLRRLDEMDGDKQVRQFIGSVYVHGVMKGEAMEDLEKGKYEVQTVALR